MAGRGGAWDSALSAGEFAAIEGAGFEPVGQVFGTAVFNVGYTGAWGCPGTWAVIDGRRVPPPTPWASWYARLGRAMYQARWLALSRAAAECRERGGDGIVGVELRVGGFSSGTMEFTLIGTAVRARSQIRPPQPFTSHLGGQDFAKLIHSGWVPTGIAFGIAVENRHDDWHTLGRIRSITTNQEIDGYTQLIGYTRREARNRLAVEAAGIGGEGVVVNEVELTVTERECGAVLGGSCDLVAEAVLVGTAITRFGRAGRPAGPRPLTLMRLEREH